MKENEEVDICLSFSKMYRFVQHQIETLENEQKEHELHSTELYLLNKPSRTYLDIQAKIDDWKWFKETLEDKWQLLLME